MEGDLLLASLLTSLSKSFSSTFDDIEPFLRDICLGGAFLCAWISILSESFAASSCLALTLFILGDAVAALVGKLIGRIYVGKKTLEGAVACFLSCLLLGYFVFPLLPEFLKKMGGEISFLQAVIIAFSIAILEMFPIKIGRLRLNDNLYVPVLVTLIAYYIIKY